MVITIYYDGDCPFCSNYSSYQKASKENMVILKNMREINADEKETLNNSGLNMNSGIILHAENEKGEMFYLQGAEALHFIASLTTERKNLHFWNILNFIVKNSKVAEKIYPLLFNIRIFLLKILKIDYRIQ
jgi:predicted DCC family thiol-disulfide oxidoreductase YuxK